MTVADAETEMTIAEVLKRLDDPPPGARSLYYRWEVEQWEAGNLGFAKDRASWLALPEDRRISVLAALACFLVPDGRVSDLLVPFVDAVPTEEQQVFLTSQLADEARVVVFCDRLRTEMIEGNGSDRVRLRSNDHLSSLLDLAQPRADVVRVEREAGPALHQGLLVLSVILDGVIAPTVQRRLGSWLEQERSFPDLTTALRAIAHDTSRHAHFGIRLLQEAVADDARDEGAIAPGLEELIEEVVPLVRGVFDDGGRVSNDFSGLPFGVDELSTDAMDCLALRMQDVGIDIPT